MNLNDYKLSKEEFDNLSPIDKKKYFFQNDLYKTKWWLRTVAKFTVVSIILALFGFLFFVFMQMVVGY